jgi:GNAT superfamily N-acetyltransferase
MGFGWSGWAGRPQHRPTVADRVTRRGQGQTSAGGAAAWDDRAVRPLDRFLQAWLGRWPATSTRDVLAWPLRAEPAWDGQVKPVQGVADGDGRWVVSVSPGREALADPTEGLATFEGVFRTTDAPAPLEPLGEWLPHDHPTVPPWLVPFGGEVLVVLDDDGAYVAGVGLKRHLPSGWELSVGTEEAARGRGYARRLVATAAAYVLDHGAVPLYLHTDDNVASARAADAAGFPDLGWRTLSVVD